MEKLLNYYIVNKKSGISFDPASIVNNKIIIAYSNVATAKNPITINVKRLITGLSEKRYRLVYKSLWI